MTRYKIISIQDQNTDFAIEMAPLQALTKTKEFNLVLFLLSQLTIPVLKHVFSFLDAPPKTLSGPIHKTPEFLRAQILRNLMMTSHANFCLWQSQLPHSDKNIQVYQI